MRRHNTINRGKRKLTVFVPAEVLARIGREKYDTGLTMEEIVTRRLGISFETQPRLDPEPAATS